MVPNYKNKYLIINDNTFSKIENEKAFKHIIINYDIQHLSKIKERVFKLILQTLNQRKKNILRYCLAKIVTAYYQTPPPQKKQKKRNGHKSGKDSAIFLHFFGYYVKKIAAKSSSLIVKF